MGRFQSLPSNGVDVDALQNSCSAVQLSYPVDFRLCISPVADTIRSYNI